LSLNLDSHKFAEEFLNNQLKKHYKVEDNSAFFLMELEKKAIINNISKYVKLYHSEHNSKPVLNTYLSFDKEVGVYKFAVFNPGNQQNISVNGIHIPGMEIKKRKGQDNISRAPFTDRGHIAKGANFKWNTYFHKKKSQTDYKEYGFWQEKGQNQLGYWANMERDLSLVIKGGFEVRFMALAEYTTTRNIPSLDNIGYGTPPISFVTSYNFEKIDYNNEDPRSFVHSRLVNPTNYAFSEKDPFSVKVFSKISKKSRVSLSDKVNETDAIDLVRRHISRAIATSNFNFLYNIADSMLRKDNSLEARIYNMMPENLRDEVNYIRDFARHAEIFGGLKATKRGKGVDNITILEARKKSYFINTAYLDIEKYGINIIDQDDEQTTNRRKVDHPDKSFTKERAYEKIDRKVGHALNDLVTGIAARLQRKSYDSLETYLEKLTNDKSVAILKSKGLTDYHINALDKFKKKLKDRMQNLKKGEGINFSSGDYPFYEDNKRVYDILEQLQFKKYKAGYILRKTKDMSEIREDYRGFLMDNFHLLYNRSTDSTSKFLKIIDKYGDDLDSYLDEGKTRIKFNNDLVPMARFLKENHGKYGKYLGFIDFEGVDIDIINDWDYDKVDNHFLVLRDKAGEEINEQTAKLLKSTEPKKQGKSLYEDYLSDFQRGGGKGRVGDSIIARS
jgi:hypothetical protein